MNRYSASQAQRLLPLLRSVTREIGELREDRKRTAFLIADLEKAATVSPEGFKSALDEAHARLAEIAEDLRRCIHELFRLGVYLQNTSPFVLHIPGISKGDKVVFRWQEGESTIKSIKPANPGRTQVGPWLRRA